MCGKAGRSLLLGVKFHLRDLSKFDGIEQPRRPRWNFSHGTRHYSNAGVDYLVKSDALGQSGTAEGLECTRASAGALESVFPTHGKTGPERSCLAAWLER